MSDSTAGELRAEQLDDFDRRILAIYQYDTRVTGESIGLSVGLSAAAVQRRLKRLRTRGVIAKEEARLDAKALGLPTTCIVGVDLEYERNQHVDEFKRQMRDHPNVQQCYYVTGSLDFVLVVVTRSLQEYEDFTREALMEHSNVRSFTTLVSMDTVKAGYALPLSDSTSKPQP